MSQEQEYLKDSDAGKVYPKHKSFSKLTSFILGLLLASLLAGPIGFYIGRQQTVSSTATSNATVITKPETTQLKQLTVGSKFTIMDGTVDVTIEKILPATKIQTSQTGFTKFWKIQISMGIDSSMQPESQVNTDIELFSLGGSDIAPWIHDEHIYVSSKIQHVSLFFDADENNNIHGVLSYNHVAIGKF